MTRRLEVLGPVGVRAVQVLGRGGLAAALAGSIASWVALATGRACGVSPGEPGMTSRGRAISLRPPWGSAAAPARGLAASPATVHLGEVPVRLAA